jgi:hypothetical protein
MPLNKSKTVQGHEKYPNLKKQIKSENKGEGDL